MTMQLLPKASTKKELNTMKEHPMEEDQTTDGREEDELVEENLLCPKKWFALCMANGLGTHIKCAKK